MKKNVLALLILFVTFSCVFVSAPPIGEHDFPLKQVAKLSVEGVIKKIAVGDTWIAVSTSEKIIAMDIDVQKILWRISFSTDSYSKFQIIDDKLFAASNDQIIMVDRQGLEKEIALAPFQETFPSSINIIKLIAVYPNYLYVIRGLNWNLEAYDISKNAMLWRKQVGRGIVDVSYDPMDKFVYVTIDDTVYVDDNLTGEFIRKTERQFGKHLVDGVLYTLTNIANTDAEVHYKISAVDTITQKMLWQNGFVLPTNNYVGDFLTVDDLLVFSGDGIVAFDKSNGEQKWKIDVHTFGESFDAPPVEFNNVIYAMGYASNTVFAVSADDGSIIGTANLEKDISFDTSYGEVFRLKDGILFNTSNSVVIYKKE